MSHHPNDHKESPRNEEEKRGSVCTMDFSCMPECCSQWRRNSKCANTGGNCKFRKPEPERVDLRIDDFATDIIEGSGGMNEYERHELVVWPYSDRIAASVWTMRCLSNPDCAGSEVALAAIMARREAMKKNKEPERVERYCDDCKSFLDMSDTRKCGECKGQDKWEAKEER